jgi:hypothetical protein
MDWVDIRPLLKALCTMVDHRVSDQPMSNTSQVAHPLLMTTSPIVPGDPPVASKQRQDTNAIEDPLRDPMPNGGLRRLGRDPAPAEPDAGVAAAAAVGGGAYAPGDHIDSRPTGILGRVRRAVRNLLGRSQ